MYLDFINIYLQIFRAQNLISFWLTAFGKWLTFFSKFWPNFSLTVLLVKLNCDFFAKCHVQKIFGLAKKCGEIYPWCGQSFNAVLIRLVAQVKISLLLKLQWRKCYNLYKSFVYKFCLQAGDEKQKENRNRLRIGIG